MSKKALIGVIGGSGLYQLDGMKVIEEINPETPWGYPSSPITVAELESSGNRVAFLARHGRAHAINPSAVPARANIAALKSLGVEVILAFSAVGSLREEIAPSDFVIPDQIIDRTKGVRPSSFFEDTKIVAHAMFGDPFDVQLSKFVAPLVEQALQGRTAPDGTPVKLHVDKTVVCMEGPQFSTRAESKMYRLLGGDIINMSVLPEAKLAREAEIGYVLICTSTDYDAWRVGEEPVTVAEVIKTLQNNAGTSRYVLATILDKLQAHLTSSSTLPISSLGSMKFSVVTQPPHQLPEDRKKLAFILPEYFA